MTAEIVNLRRHKRTKDRADKQATAAENRVVYGRTKLERQTTKVEAERVKRELDGRLLERKPEPEDKP